MYYSPERDEVFEAHHDIRRAYQNVLFPVEINDDHLAFIGVYPLVYETPEVGENQIAEPAGVLEVNGQWVQQWTIREVDPEPEEPVQSEDQSPQP